ncbi:hypothetical protein BS17DRAFT_777460 [Gyrodon lividus]|nr:hypothetical protein BS17DRAFT_777460 [Gyrodon lividus]
MGEETLVRDLIVKRHNKGANEEDRTFWTIIKTTCCALCCCAAPKPSRRTRTIEVDVTRQGQADTAQPEQAIDHWAASETAAMDPDTSASPHPSPAKPHPVEAEVTEEAHQPRTDDTTAPTQSEPLTTDYEPGDEGDVNSAIEPQAPPAPVAITTGITATSSD